MVSRFSPPVKLYNKYCYAVTTGNREVRISPPSSSLPSSGSTIFGGIAGTTFCGLSLV